MDHFPFFLVAFPKTAKALSCELGVLLKDSERSALWERAISLLRQRYDVDHPERRCGPSQFSQQFAEPLQEFIKTIPAHSDLWHCFGLEEYLREGLRAAVGKDALGLPPPPYGAKLLRCAPGNHIILTSQMDPINWFSPRTTQDHRDEVTKYVRKIQQGVLRGRERGPAYYDDYAEFLDHMVELINRVKSKGKNPH